jgi:hypothetical protein
VEDPGNIPLVSPKHRLVAGFRFFHGSGNLPAGTLLSIQQARSKTRRFSTLRITVSNAARVCIR